MNGDVLQWENEKWKRQTQSGNQWQTLPLLLCDVNTLRFFFLSFFFLNPFKLWVCLLLSLSGPYSNSLSRSKKPVSLFLFLYTAHTHARTGVLNCCIRTTQTLQSTHALQESQKRGDILPYKQTSLFLFFFFFWACFPAQTLQFAASCVFMSTVNTDTL